jgi:hypothetical protein
MLIVFAISRTMTAAYRIWEGQWRRRLAASPLPVTRPMRALID